MNLIRVYLHRDLVHALERRLCVIATKLIKPLSLCKESLERISESVVLRTALAA
jgi:hypothetical protein